MKARELIIGDLVRIIEPDKYHGAICRIVSIIDHKDDECAYFKVFVLTKGNLLHEVCNEDIEPIPLTSAILEKNGWVFIEGQDYSTFPVPSKWVNQSVSFALKVNGETYNIANTFLIKYVHELQHALRLFGLDGLADNFKI